MKISISKLLNSLTVIISLTACQSGIETNNVTTKNTEHGDKSYHSITINEDTSQWWKNAVVYEIWPRSFADSDGDGNGDFNGMTNKLDYLQDLGVNGVWLTPMFEAPSYHGYDFQNFYQVEEDYGTMQDFEHFVEQAHQHDIKVILDLVLNHISNEHAWFKKSAAQDSEFSDYFVWKKAKPTLWGKAWEDTPNPDAVWHWNEERQAYYYGVFGKSQPDLNLEHPAVVNEIKKITKFWLDKGVDGFRLDAARYVKERELPGGEDAIQIDSTESIAFWHDFQTYATSLKSDVLLIGEVWADVKTTSKYWNNGDGLDSVFDFDFGNIVTGLLNNVEQEAEFGTATLNETLDGRDALWNNLINRTNYAPIYYHSAFLTNHDQTRIMKSIGDDFIKAKVAASLLFTTPGSVYMYYGEEIGLSQPETLEHEYRRAIMQWNEDEYSGFNKTGNVWLDQKHFFESRAEHKPWWQHYWQEQRKTNSRSVAAQESNPESLLIHYKALIKNRHESPELQFPEEIRYYPVDNKHVWLVKNIKGAHSSLTIINLDTVNEVEFTIPVTLSGQYRDKLTTEKINLIDVFTLNPGQTLIL